MHVTWVFHNLLSDSADLIRGQDYGDAGHQPSIEDVTDFMEKTTTWLDATPWI